MKASLLLILGMAFVESCRGDDSDTFDLGPNGQVKSAHVQAWNVQNAKSAFIIIPGFGDNPADFSLLELTEWKRFALQNHIALFTMDVSLMNWKTPPAKMDFLPAAGVSDIILQAVNQECKTTLPIFLYGKNDPGTNIILSAIVTSPQSFSGWCCMGPTFLKCLPILPRSLPTPGVVVATTDSVRYDDAKSFFSMARKRDEKITWLGTKPIDSGKVRDFVRQYALSLLASPSGEWLNVESKQPMQSDDADNNPETASWLPNDSVGTLWTSLETPLPVRPKIIEKDIDLTGQGLGQISLYLRLPIGMEDAGGVSGVLAFCTWIKDKDNLIQELSNDPDQPPEKAENPSVQMVRFASKHNLALLTWSTPGTWNKTENDEELTEDEKVAVDAEFDTFAEAWDRGVAEFCNTDKLPENQYLLWGMSRGAQWAHRLALRDSKRFLAVNPHVSGSYDVPTASGKRCLWLITTGQLDGGAEDSKRFYEQCEQAGYSVMIKMPDGLGHKMRADVDAVRDAFFEYALSIKDTLQGDNVDAGGLLSLKNAKFVGDYVSQKTVPVSQADQIRETYQVYLPTDNLARAWSTSPPPPITFAADTAISSGTKSANPNH